MTWGLPVPPLSVGRDNSSLEFDSLTPVDFLAGKVVGCFVHGGV